VASKTSIKTPSNRCLILGCIIRFKRGPHAGQRAILGRIFDWDVELSQALDEGAVRLNNNEFKQLNLEVRTHTYVPIGTSKEWVEPGVLSSPAVELS
jgi:hypothetical protein